jgi:pantothenate kinase type III
VLDLIEHWREGGAWTQQWITLRTVVDLLVHGGDHEGGAVLLGALASSGRSIELFGADADRLERARGAIDRALDDAAEAMLARGAALSDLECVRYAVARIQRLIRRE